MAPAETALELRRGDSPVILCFPHVGTSVPESVALKLNDNGRLLADTDWHVDRLYEGLLPGATTLRANIHRYVVDANRDPSGQSLYPGQNTTGLVPATDFDGKPIWREGGLPDTEETCARIARWHRPYHAALEAEIARIKARHGVVIIYDCHSIRSRIPFLFEGTLPDFNIGTHDGLSCAPRIQASLAADCAQASGYTSVLNGRFKGGWTTRNHGRPSQGVHVVQMELAQSTHLSTEAPPFAYDEGKAARLRPHLKTILENLERIAHDLAH